MNVEYHPWNFLVLPCVLVSCGTCDQRGCDSSHWRLTLGWFVWSLHLDFSDEH